MKKIICAILCALMVLCLLTAAAEGEWKCPSCGKEGLRHNFCNDCGTPRPEPTAVPESWSCLICGAMNGGTISICWRCGNGTGTTPTPRPAPIFTPKAGDYITFGTYPQGANGEVEPIEWTVLDVQGDRALVISRYGLDAKPYNTENKDVTWETSTIRAWLNGEFYNTAFTAEDKNRILTTAVKNSELSYSGRTGGNDTKDKIFLLSYAEAVKYFDVTREKANNLASRVRPTEYAISRGASAYNDYKTADGAAAGYWWLRSPGHLWGWAARVSFNGSLNDDGVIGRACVRPAFWINLKF